jgi:hypothetical protein
MQPDPWERCSIVLILRTARVTDWREGPTAEG